MEKPTQEEIKADFEDFNEVIDDFKRVGTILDKKFGRNYSASQKIRTIYETMESFTQDEFFNVTEAIKEDTVQNPQK